MGSQPEKGCIKCSIVKKKHLWEIAIAAEQFSQDITIYFYFCKKIRSLKAHFINLNFQDHTLTSCPKRKCPSNLDPLQPIESHVFRRGFCCPSSSPTPNKLTFPGHFPPTTRGIIDPPNSRVRCGMSHVELDRPPATPRVHWPLLSALQAQDHNLLRHHDRPANRGKGFHRRGPGSRGVCNNSPSSLRKGPRTFKSLGHMGLFILSSCYRLIGHCVRVYDNSVSRIEWF